MIRLFISVSIALLCSCNTKTIDKRIPLKSNIENNVKLGDTLVIFASDCKGCAFSTTYSFKDSLGIIKKTNYKSYDPCPECDGGSYSVEIEFVALSTGKTTLKMYMETSESYEVSDTLDEGKKPNLADTTPVAKFNIVVKNK
ncbi:MAG: hypothetical protein IT243_05685 [Bacteroidia bacterium]|nr:hypothetical protein [Bacteroidia bacterium]